MRWLALILLALAAPAAAEDYYCVKTTGTKGSGVSTTDIDAFGWANADCYATIQGAINQMSGGDQVWVDDGTYSSSGTLATLTSAESGPSSLDYTILRARNHGDAILSSTGASGVKVESGASYIRIEGFHVAQVAKDPTDAASIYLSGPNHVTVKRCSWAMDTGLALGSCEDILWEDCFAYGGPLRYAFQNSTGSNRILYRRCLVRWDFSDISEPTACFGSYQADSVAYQNCVAVDGTDHIGIRSGTEPGSKAFFTPNGSTNVWYTGCMVVAMSGFCGWWLEGNPGATGWFTDCVAWNLLTDAEDYLDIYEPQVFASTSSNANWELVRCTFGVNDQGYQLPSQGDPISFNLLGYESMRNCIIYGMELGTGIYAVGGNLNDHDYNLYYANTGGRNKSGGVGSNSIIDHDPRSYGLFHVTQIEPCSFCQTAGENGGQIGAQIKTKIGVDGTYLGEPGWNDDTGNPLWPFPYEDEIREKCAAFYKAAGDAYSIAGGSDYDSPEMDGARGFCAPGRTLTSWLLSGGE